MTSRTLLFGDIDRMDAHAFALYDRTNARNEIADYRVYMDPSPVVTDA